MIRIALVAAIAAAVASAVPASAQQWQKDALKGQHSSICEKKTVVIKSERQWTELWKEHHGAAEAAPAVDFSREMVVAVFLGEKNKAGWSVELVTMPDPLDKRRLVVFYKEIAPKGGFAAEVISHPYAMLKVKIHDSVTFEVNQRAAVPELQAPPKRITDDQKVRMYDSVGRIEAFGSFDGFNRP